MSPIDPVDRPSRDTIGGARFLDADAAARYFGMGKRTFEERVAAGTLPEPVYPFEVPGKRKRDGSRDRGDRRWDARELIAKADEISSSRLTPYERLGDEIVRAAAAPRGSPRRGRAGRAPAPARSSAETGSPPPGLQAPSPS